MGNVGADTEKPAPVRLTELIVTAAAPVEVKVTDCAAGVFTATLPKETLLVLTVSTGVATITST